MKKIIVFILSLFLVSGLFAEWKQVEIPAKLTNIVEMSYDNGICRITKTFDDKLEVWFDSALEVNDLELIVDFTYSDEIWEKLLSNETTDLWYILQLVNEYDYLSLTLDPKQSYYNHLKKGE